jgi:predicted ABC-type sugar transport system permease subunit
VEYLIPEAIMIGIAAGLLARPVIGYLTVPLVGLAVGTWWASREAGDVGAATADIFENQAPEALLSTSAIFALSAGQAALAAWLTIGFIEWALASNANRKMRNRVTPRDPGPPRRPT